MMMEKKFDPIVPVTLGKDLATTEDLRMIRRKYGIHRFIITGPGASVFMTGYPDMACYERIARQILEAKQELSDTDIELYWWCEPTLNSGLNAPYQHIVNYDGNVSVNALCPLDPGFRQDFSRKIARVAEIAHPEIIQFEDDYELSNHPGVTFGCFCPLHLAALEEKTHSSWTREKLLQVFSEDRRETLELRRIFAEIRKQSLLLLASDIRKEVDKVAPETRLSVCEPGTTDLDGYVSIDEPRVFAGKNTTPLIRVYGSSYSCSDSPQDLPACLSHTMYTAERLPGDFEWMHESDPYPHTTYFMSSKYLETEIHASLAMGADNSLLYATQYLDDPCEDPSYFEMYKKNAKRFEAIRQACSGGKLDGCRIIHHHGIGAAEARASITGKNCGAWADACAFTGRMGFPYSTKYGSPAILAGYEADFISDDDMTELLKGGLLLDSIAAKILSERGFSSFIGTDLKKLQGFCFSKERIADLPEFAHIKGRLLYNWAFFPSGSEKTDYYELVPHEGAQILTHFLDPEGHIVQPGMTFFTNFLGGRVCVMAGTIGGNKTSTLYSPRKQELLRIVFARLRGSALPAAVSGAPNVWLLCRNTPRGTLLFVTALTCDGRKDLLLRVSGPLKDASFEEISDDGEWLPASVERNEKGIILKGDFPVMRTRIFRAKD